MMSDIIRNGERSWGDDPYQDLVEARQKGELVQEAENSVYRSYMAILRTNFESDPVTRRILEEHNPAKTALNELAKHLADVIRSGTEDMFQRCLSDILSELDQQRAAPPALYLVDQSTGRVLIPVSEKAVYQPPDYIGEDGKVHQARKVLHPGIAAPLTMALHEKEKNDAAIAKHGMAMEHVRNPDSIREAAIAILEEAGFVIGNANFGRQVEIEFGRENLDALQSINPRFHRHAAFGRSLATRIIQESQGAKICSIGQVQLKKNSKFRWYAVKAYFPWSLPAVA